MIKQNKKSQKGLKTSRVPNNENRFKITYPSQIYLFKMNINNKLEFCFI